jgi:hypothetical protein
MQTMSSMHSADVCHLPCCVINRCSAGGTHCGAEAAAGNARRACGCCQPQCRHSAAVCSIAWPAWRRSAARKGWVPACNKCLRSTHGASINHGVRSAEAFMTSCHKWHAGERRCSGAQCRRHDPAARGLVRRACRLPAAAAEAVSCQHKAGKDVDIDTSLGVLLCMPRTSGSRVATVLCAI